MNLYKQYLRLLSNISFQARRLCGVFAFSRSPSLAGTADHRPPAGVSRKCSARRHTAASFRCFRLSSRNRVASGGLPGDGRLSTFSIPGGGEAPPVPALHVSGFQSCPEPHVDSVTEVENLLNTGAAAASALQSAASASPQILAQLLQPPPFRRHPQVGR